MALATLAFAAQQSLEELRVAGAENLAGKVLVDVANPMDILQGMPPFLDLAFTGATRMWTPLVNLRVVRA